MRLKKLALAGALFAGFNFAQAGALEELIRSLQENGYITEEQAQRILAEAQAEKAKSSASEDEELKKIVKALKGLKIGGKAYLHYDYTLNGLNKSDDDKNEFKVTRAYFEVRKYFDNSKSNYFRMTLDVFKSKDTDDAEDGYQVRLKYAYLNWALTPWLQTEIGLAHRPAIDWLEHHIWKHRYMDKTFLEDKYGAHLMNSADLGVAFKGKIQNLAYMFGIYNGEGYHGAENDHHFGKSVEGRVNYEVIKGLNIGLHAAYIDHDKKAKADRYVVHPFAVYENQIFLVGVQYIWNKEKDKEVAENTYKDFKNSGFVVNGDLKLKGLVGVPATIFARYGAWNFDNDYEKVAEQYNERDKFLSKKEGVDRNQYIIGAEYKFNKHVKLGLSYKHVKWDKKPHYKNSNGQIVNYDRDHLDQIMAAMEVKW